MFCDIARPAGKEMWVTSGRGAGGAGAAAWVGGAGAAAWVMTTDHA